MEHKALSPPLSHLKDEDISRIRGPKPSPQPQTQLQPSTSLPPQNNNPMIRKAPGPKMSEQKKRRTIVPAKRRYKVRVIVQLIPTTPMPTTPVNLTPTVPIPTVATTSTQMPMVKSAPTSILVTVYNLATGKFAEVPYPSERPQAEKNPSIHNSNPPPLEAIPNAPVRQDTPWPSTESASENLLETRKDWPIPPTPAPTVKKEVPH